MIEAEFSACEKVLKATKLSADTPECVLEAIDFLADTDLDPSCHIDDLIEYIELLQNKSS